MDLNEIEDKVKELFTKHGLYELGWKFKWDNSTKRTGLCNYTTKTISLSKKISPQRNEADITNTILHEIAHVLAGFDNHHNDIWRETAISIGCDGNRCSYDVDVKYTYKGLCPACSKVHWRNNIKNASCSSCDDKFNPEYILVWEKMLE
jgi:predicted SprT family Zn-dependent metalloprotease